jgi:hypothetical protein
MQRLIEQPTGNGELVLRGVPLGRVHYHLAVYHHFADGTDPMPAHHVVEGRVVAESIDLVELQHAGAEVTLRLADGRALDLRITHEDGTIHSTARGLYAPPA